MVVYTFRQAICRRPVSAAFGIRAHRQAISRHLAIAKF
jgi:hypothetical protein